MEVYSLNVLQQRDTGAHMIYSFNGMGYTACIYIDKQNQYHMGKKARDRSLDIKGQCCKTAFNIALVKVKVTQSCDSLRPHGLPWNSPGQNTGVGSLSLLERIFTTQGSNPGLPNCRQILYQLSHKGTPKDTRECWILLLLDLKTSWKLCHIHLILGEIL